MLKRRELEALREDNARLSELIDILRTIPETEAQAMLGKLRNTTADIAALMPSGRDRPLLETMSRQVVARLPAQGSLEFELMVRHAVAYPTLAPLDAGGVGFTSLLTCAVARSVADELRYASCDPIAVGGHAFLRLAYLRFMILMMSFCHSSDLLTTASSSTSAPRQPLASEQGQGQRFAPASWTVLCDSRLELLDISSWSQVAITSERAAALISLYLETDHPTLGFFDADLFLADLIHVRMRHCSPLLVSAILSWACVSALEVVQWEIFF